MDDDPLATLKPSQLPAPCPKCAGTGMPFHIETILHSSLLRVRLRCSICRLEWTLLLTDDNRQ